MQGKRTAFAAPAVCFNHCRTAIRRTRFLTLATAATGTLLACDWSSAAPRTWLNGSGGSYEVSANWSASAVPGASDSATFNLNSSPGYTVVLSQNRTIQTLTVANDNTTVNLAGFTLTTTTPSSQAFLVGGPTATDVGRLTINNGTFAGAGATMGSVAGAVGSFTISGVGAVGSFTSSTTVGASGTGILSMLAGGALDTPLCTVGSNAGASGSVSVVGGGSALNTSGVGGCVIGNAGNGTVAVSQSGASATTNGVTVGALAGGAGTVNINTFATWTNTGGFTLGNGGSGTLLASLGSLSSTSGRLGASAGALGYASLGALSGWSCSGSLEVGVSGVGTIEVSAGGSLSAGQLILGGNPSGRGMLRVSGFGALAATTGSLVVGNLGEGTLDISGGADVTTGIEAQVGSSGRGTVLVHGTGSTWGVTGLVVLGGASGSAGGTVSVTGGGSVTSNGASLGAGVGAEGSAVEVAGAGSAWTSNGTFSVGGFGGNPGSAATLMIGSSGSVIVTPANRMQIFTPGAVRLQGGTLSVGSLQNNGGSFAFDSGTVSITGPSGLSISSGGPLGATFDASPGRTLSVSNTLTISSGAMLTTSGGSVSAATIANSGEIYLGSRTSLLSGTINNSGLIDGDGRISGPLVNSASGEVRADAGKRVSFSAGGGANSNTGQINLFGGTIEFTDLLTNNLAGKITGRGTLIAAGAGIANSGSMLFSAGATDVNATLANASGSKVIVTGGSTGTFFKNVTNNPGSEFRVSTASTAVFLGFVNGLGAFTGPGTKDFEGGGAGIAINTGNGTTIVGPAATVTTTGGGVRDGIVSIEGTLTVAPAGTSAAASRIGTLAITGGTTPLGTFDLNDNDLLLAATAESLVSAQLSYARNFGAWDQPGITSSLAAAHPQGATTLGLLDGAEYDSIYGPGATFNDLAVNTGDVLVKYTWYGDSDFTGFVDFDDYVRIDNGFNSSLNGWLNGDFDLSGGIDFDDYVLIDLAFNAQNGTLRRAQAFLSGDDRGRSDMTAPALVSVLEHFDRFGLPYAHNFLSAVPEPGALGGALAGCGFTLRRCRRQRRCRAVSSRA